MYTCRPCPRVYTDERASQCGYRCPLCQTSLEVLNSMEPPLQIKATTRSLPLTGESCPSVEEDPSTGVEEPLCSSPETTGIHSGTLLPGPVPGIVHPEAATVRKYLEALSALEYIPQGMDLWLVGKPGVLWGTSDLYFGNPTRAGYDYANFDEVSRWFLLHGTSPPGCFAWNPYEGALIRKIKPEGSPPVDPRWNFDQRSTALPDGSYTFTIEVIQGLPTLFDVLKPKDQG